jgi:hypothetical protein
MSARATSTLGRRIFRAFAPGQCHPLLSAGERPGGILFTTYMPLAAAELTFEKVRAFSVLSERPLWWASLYSRAFTTICVGEVPAPRSRPTTRQARGTGGYNFLLKQTHGVDARPPRPEPRTSLASPQNRARMQPAQV